MIYSKAKSVKFSPDQYVNQVTEKSIFVIHHSAGSNNAIGMFKGWENDKLGRVSTAFGIENDGGVFQGFDTTKWGYAINLPAKGETKFKPLRTGKQDAILNGAAIQVELCSWGGLKKVGNKFYCWVDNFNQTGHGYEIPADQVVEYATPFKGFKYFQKYSPAMIASLRDVIKECQAAHPKIVSGYHEDMWDVSERAMKGAPGIWTHVSYRSTKSDCHPQPELIAMLKTI